ncbi:MAG: Do family serine endopeptidase [Thermoanaerobaculia bacterium]|nr:Do family serine endopeptidase [Thermoanaerobaculia bacterium]
MSHGRSRQTLTFSMLAAAVVFGVVLAGGLDLTPVGMAAPQPAESGAAPERGTIPLTGQLPSFADLAERALPAVVSIDAQTIGRAEGRGGSGAPSSPFDFFFGPQNPRRQPGESPREFRSDSGGSGFVISADGYVITNNHVIDGATKVRVRLDGRLYDAEVKGTDPATDLALLKIEASEPLDFLPLGDSDSLRVGDYVMAIGNPLLLDHTVTVGVVSAKGRSIGLTADASFENFIQTDAAINRGNSGGPLVNLRGEVVGIATAMNWGAENIGFAVPVSTLKAILPQLREKGRVSRGYLGVNIQNLDFDRAQAFGLADTAGALVTEVTPDSPAEKAGLRHGDVIVEVDGRRVESTRDLIDYVAAQAPGEKVRLAILREGDRSNREVLLGERSAANAEAEEPEDDAGSGIEWLGLEYQEITPGLRQNHGLPADLEGIVIRQVAPSSPLYDEGVVPGDLISEVNGTPVGDARAFEQAVGAAPSGSYLRLYVRRFDPRGRGDGLGFFAIVRVP